MNKPTTPILSYFQIYFTNKFRNRDYRVVAAATETKAMDNLQVAMAEANQPIKNLASQKISEEQYKKFVEGKQNVFALPYSSFE